MKRSGKFYRKNEKEVMSMLGLRPTINSGSGWIEKEDGQNEKVICQLKSTDAQSIKVNLKDIQTLEYNALVVHKIPVFAVQFIDSDETFLIMRPEHLNDLSIYLNTKEYKTSESIIEFDDIDDVDLTIKKKKVKSSKNARESFMKENESKFKKEKRKAR